jgi:hypothetical protein
MDSSSFLLWLGFLVGWVAGKSTMQNKQLSAACFALNHGEVIPRFAFLDLMSV